MRSLFKFHLFSDDTNKDLRTMERVVNAELANLSDWLLANKLILNTSKSIFVIFDRIKRFSHQHQTIYYFLNVKIMLNTLVYYTFAVHYEKIRTHLRETATNSAEIRSLVRENKHLRINQIQLISIQ